MKVGDQRKRTKHESGLCSCKIISLADIVLDIFLDIFFQGSFREALLPNAFEKLTRLVINSTGLALE